MLNVFSSVLVLSLQLISVSLRNIEQLLDIKTIGLRFKNRYFKPTLGEVSPVSPCDWDLR